MAISDIDPASPASNDQVVLGDDQIRGLKQDIVDSWGGIDGLVLAGTGNPAATAADMTGLFDQIAALTQGVGTGFVGEVRMWYGIAEDVPAGWYICDGSNGTPDLRDRFVYGADSTTGLPTNGGVTTGGTVGAGSTGPGGGHNHGLGSVNDHTIALANLPEHEHALFRNEVATNTNVTVAAGQAAAAETTGGADENQRYQITAAPNDPSNVVPNVGRTGKAGASSPASLTHTGNTDVVADHVHDLTGALPPWHAMYFIMFTGA